VPRAWRAAVLALAALAACGCARSPDSRDALQQIRDRGALRVVTLNSPTSYYLGGHGFEGLDYELARDFARSLGLRLEIRTVADQAALRAELRERRADLAAAHLTYDERWAGYGLPAAPHQEVARLWLYRRGEPRPASEADVPPARRAVAGEAPGDPLDRLRRGELDAVQIGSYEFAFARPLHPEFGVAFTAPAPRPVQWILRSDAGALLAAVDGFMAEERRSGRLDGRIRRTLDAPRRLGSEAMREFGTQVRERLPALQKHFEHASVRTGIDWRLLAALAYQESRWDERAVSAQGARGILMLMPEVLSASGVRDPFDPRQNILAGARHLFALKQRLPGRIGEPDRTWLAIAAYNAGPGALEDARIVTQMRGGNPDSWSDVYDNLPLLAEEDWYTRVRNGYSRGWETQVTIDRVREFADVLAWRTTRPDAAPIAATGP
jgi:membrane-bound lytic murein transglycosylase F